MFNLSGRVAVVTGGSSGLGVQFAHALGRHADGLRMRLTEYFKAQTFTVKAVHLSASNEERSSQKPG